MGGDHIDLDAFAFGEEVELEPRPVVPRPPRPVEAAGVRPDIAQRVTREVAGMPIVDDLPDEQPMQTTLEGGEVAHGEEPLERTATDRIRAIIFESRSGGHDHIVVFHRTKEGEAPLCNCEASMSLARRPSGCWSMVEARRIKGLPEVHP